eukprot:gnl/MRDRNA2_/MRDRNA2_78688_c0_seq1.p1 gnl/MRDRNA2_/MRDRNA2_78688_c0~~gnl/MRDRNA2_/MRDRNA2_78688_c0_seq1.p1  ORF type:complete len:472 (+),score=35.28 gnl/MRDRNA2_/MRDRNA2_78688_c0_seq1:156-1418(+)
MTSKWADAFMQVSSFVNSSVACGVAPDKLYAWREQMAHWFSLMNALAIVALRGPLSTDGEGMPTPIACRDLNTKQAEAPQAWDLIPNTAIDSHNIGSPNLLTPGSPRLPWSGSDSLGTGTNSSSPGVGLKMTHQISTNSQLPRPPGGSQMGLAKSRKSVSRCSRTHFEGRRSVSMMDKDALKVIRSDRGFRSRFESLCKNFNPIRFRAWLREHWPVNTSRLGENIVDVPVLQRITAEEEAVLNVTDDKVLIVCGWLTASLTRKLASGDLKVPPPICSRCYQELSNGMLGFNQAMKVAVVPFPFPFAQMLSLLLMGFVLTCPVAVLQFTQSLIFTPLLNFFAVLGYWGLNEIACELENPFGDDPNDLPVMEIHHDFLTSIEEQFIAHPHLADVPQPKAKSRQHETLALPGCLPPIPHSISK